MRKWWLAATLLLFAAFFYIRQRPTIEPTRVTLPADGAQHNALTIHFPWLNFNRITVDGPGRIEAQAVFIQSPVNPGQTQLHILWRHRKFTVPIRFEFAPTDSYGDGTPDFLRLHTAQDRDAFRTWFTLIAQSQLEQTKPEVKDCAALLRYAYRETLHAHDEPWLLSHSLQSTAPSVRQFIYPETPLGANLFRVAPGPFLPIDLDNGSFAQFADAQTLMRRNTHLIGRDVRLAHPGDLIFYRQLGYDSPFHSMIVTGEAVVYHTGPIQHGKGEMRRLLLTDLLHHPDARWRPLQENENFLGVYRWNILREGD